MQKYMYVRISTADQNENRQLDAARELGIPKSNIFVDKQSGKDTARPGLQKLLAAVERGDTVFVESVSRFARNTRDLLFYSFAKGSANNSRFARNTRDLLELIDKLTAKGVEFVSQKEHIDTTTPTGKFMLTVFGAVAELERGYILQRQAEGIAAAKRRGVHMGRPVKKAPDNFGEIVKQWERKQMPLPEVLKQCGCIGETTFYRRLGEYRLLKGIKNVNS